VPLNASRHYARARLEGRAVQVTLNSCPGFSFDEVDRRLLAKASDRPRASVSSLLSDFVPAAVAEAFAQVCGIDGAQVGSQLSRESRRGLVHAFVDRPLAVVDTRGYTYAEATAGGVPLDEVDAATMASKICPGLFLVGEVLDVDGRLGGFNFQWAWATARVAGAALAQSRDAGRK
jgi:predicted Rossmann fold flavoprotein